MDLECIILTKITQYQRKKSHSLSHMQNLANNIYVYIGTNVHVGTE